MKEFQKPSQQKCEELTMLQLLKGLTGTACKHVEQDVSGWGGSHSPELRARIRRGLDVVRNLYDECLSRTDKLLPTGQSHELRPQVVVPTQNMEGIFEVLAAARQENRLFPFAKPLLLLSPIMFDRIRGDCSTPEELQSKYPEFVRIEVLREDLVDPSWEGGFSIGDSDSPPFSEEELLP